ncbi:MAG: Ig-like domain-containing protein [Candidatus Thermoplasmatota archaeon]|nr:Ig-like domain-containing protein [Candidatus Thermoplasmatota archaeon]
MDGFDHGRYYTYSMWSGASDGWRTYGLGMGEYEIYTYLDADPAYNIQISARSNLVMNSSDVTLEVPVANPQMAPVDILIKNSSGPLQWAYVYYGCEVHEDQGTTRIGSDRNTNATGRVRVFVPVGIPVTLDTNANGHHDKSIEIMALNTDPMELEITLVEMMTGAATTPVRFTVIDVITSIPLPDVYLDGNGLSGGSYEYFYTRTNATGQATVNVVPGDYRVNAYSNLGRKDLEMRIGATTTDVKIVLDRYAVNPEKVNASFHVVDPMGIPVPGMRLSMYSKDPYYIYTSTSSALSDENGRVDLQIYPGNYSIYIDDIYPDISYRSVWRVPDQTMLNIPITGVAENITVYPAKPLERISGKTYDSLGDPLGQVNIYSMSVHDLKRPRLNPLTFEWLRDQVYLYGMWDGGSVSDGYFRSWGVDHTYMGFYKDGYKPVFREMDQNTRSMDDLVIVMDEDDLTRFNVSGRVVDGGGNGVKGMIVATDPERGGAHLDYDEVKADGSFSMRTYPGRIRLVFTNMTVIDTWDLDLDADVNDLILTLDPESYLDVVVQDEQGNPVEGAEVKLMKGEEDISSSVSGGDGKLFFDIPAGDYRLVIERSELYDAYEGDVFSMNGIDDMTMTITLPPRTEADVSGYVTANGGPLDGEPIMDVIVRIFDGTEMTFETISNETGGYIFQDVPHGIIRITATPPETLAYAYGTSGYLDLDSGGMLLGGSSYIWDIGLEYREWEEVGTFNVTYYSPTGADVPLNAPIVIEFSSPVDETELGANVVITPLPGNLSLALHEDGKRVMIDHDPFEPMTEYEVVVLQTLSSAGGEVLWNLSEVRWSFTTGSEAATWALYTREVILDDGKNLSASVTGMTGLTVFMVIDGIGSFEMIEGDDGTYEVEVPGTGFEWNTTYNYHFSNSQGGIDMAPMLSGSFRTPAEPAGPPVTPDWNVDSVIVTVGNDGSWEVWAQGEPGLDVYIVIDGVGSFPLTETSPGIYEATVPGSNFKRGRTYSYHLSDSAGGEAKTDVYTAKVPAEAKVDGPKTRWGCFVCGGCGIVLLLLLVILVLIVMTRRSGKRVHEE